MQSTTPDRSLAQRMDALGRANDVRSRRAQLKKDVKAGRVSVVSVLTAPPAVVDTMKVFDLLLAAPKYGRVKTTKVLQQCRMAMSKTVGGMSERQRLELVAMVSGPSAPRPTRRPPARPITVPTGPVCADCTNPLRGKVLEAAVEHDDGVCGWCRAERAEKALVAA